MRPRSLALVAATSLACILAAPLASAQSQLKPKQQTEAEKAKKEAGQAEGQQQGQTAQATTSAEKPAIPAGQCLPDGKRAGYGVNTFEDILVERGFDPDRLEAAKPQDGEAKAEAAQPVEWKPVEEEPAPKSR